MSPLYINARIHFMKVVDVQQVSPPINSTRFRIAVHYIPSGPIATVDNERCDESQDYCINGR